MKGKKLAATLCAAAMAASFAGCAPGTGTDISDSDTFVYLSSWTREGVGSHLNSGANIGPLNYFTVEGLARYVRISNEVVYQLAESFEHLDENADGEIVTRVHLKEDAKWHDGHDFVADDVRGYYILNHGTVTEYIYDIVAADDKTVEFYWRPELEPSDEIKDLMLSQDKAGAVPYHVFKTQVDKCREILQNCPAVDANVLAPFGKRISGENMSAYTSNYQDYRNVTTDWFIGTGPYKMEKMSSTQMILTRVEDYYDVEKIGFKNIKAINGVNDLNTIYAQLEAGTIDYQDGTPARDVLERIIARNENMAHYKIYDPGSIGLLFNLDKEIWTPGVREAFQYIFDRDQIKNIANYYAITSWYPMMTMAPSETEQYMSEEGLAYLAEHFTYRYDTSKAEELLKAEGWTKEGGQWYRNGEPVTLLLAYDGSNSYFRTSAEVAASQLNAFGIPTTLNRYGEWGTFYSNAIEQGTSIDLVACWTDLNMTMPYGSFSYAYDGPITDLCHVPRYVDGEEGYALYGARPSLQLTGMDGGTFEAAAVFPGIYSISDPEELAATTDDLVVGMARNLYGVQFFQNVTGAFWNIGKVAGLPHEEEVRAQRNYTYIPSEGEDFDAWAKINVLYSFGTVLTDGTLYPRASEETA